LQNNYFCRLMKIKLNWDIMGAATSIACAIHCAVLPILMTSLSIFGVNIIHNQWFEWGMIFLAFFVGAYSLLHGFLKHHQSYIPLLVFCAGVLFLVLKQLLHLYEFWFLVPAVALILYAHYTNYRLCQKSKCSSPHHKH
jgi:MerC mercury resistance protein